MSFLFVSKQWGQDLVRSGHGGQNVINIDAPTLSEKKDSRTDYPLDWFIPYPSQHAGAMLYIIARMLALVL